MNRRHAISPALLACGDHDALPVRDALHCTIGIQTNHRALGGERLYSLDPELDRFLHGVIHTLATRYALCERDVQWRLAVDRRRFSHSQDHGRSGDALYRRLVFVATTIESDEGVALAESQDAADMMRLLGGQLAFAVRWNVAGEINARQAFRRGLHSADYRRHALESAFPHGSMTS